MGALMVYPLKVRQRELQNGSFARDREGVPGSGNGDVERLGSGRFLPCVVDRVGNQHVVELQPFEEQGG